MPVLMLVFPQYHSTCKQGSTNILTVIFSISFLQWGSITLMTSSRWSQGQQPSGTEKTPNCGGQGFPAHHSLPILSKGSVFPKSPRGYPTGSSDSSLPLQLMAIQMSAKTNPHGATLCTALQDKLKRLNPGKPRAWHLPEIRAVCSSCGSVVQQIHLLNDNSFIGKPIQLKPASNKVSNSPLCIKNMESCLHFPECPQP